MCLNSGRCTIMVIDKDTIDTTAEYTAKNKYFVTQFFGRYTISPLNALSFLSRTARLVWFHSLSAVR